MQQFRFWYKNIKYINKFIFCGEKVTCKYINLISYIFISVEIQTITLELFECHMQETKMVEII